MTWHQLSSTLWNAAALVALSGCMHISHAQETPLRFHTDGTRIYAQGVVMSHTPDDFAQVLAQSPQARELVLQFAPGSMDDDANLELARMVHAAGLKTRVPAGGMVASGGTDLFLAGRVRVLEPGACIGVHSWEDSAGYEGGDLPRTHPDHRMFTDYFDEIGIDPTFYWFTLDAAPADDMHWMRPDEVNRFALTSAPAPQLGQGETCEDW